MNHTDPMKMATASEIADLLEHGGVPIDQVASLCRRSIELLREYAALTTAQQARQEQVAVCPSPDACSSHLGCVGDCAAPVQQEAKPDWSREWSQGMQSGFQRRWMHPVNHGEHQLALYASKREGYYAGWRDCAAAVAAPPQAEAQQSNTAGQAGNEGRGH